MNTTPTRHDSTASQTLPENVAPQGFPQTSNVSSRGSAGFPNPLKATPAIKLLREAVFYIDANNSVAGERYAINQGTGGPALNAKYGNSDVASTNDPLWLSRPVDGTNYVYLPGVVGNYLSVPDEAALDIVGDLEIWVAVTPENLTDYQLMFNKGDNGTGTLAYRFQLYPTGAVALITSVDGTAVTSYTASTAGAVSAGQSCWLGFTLDVDNGSAQKVVSYYKNTDIAVTPTVANSTLISTHTSAGTTSIASTVGVVEVGVAAGGGAQRLVGKVHRAIVRNGIGGTTVLDIDIATDVTSSSATSFTCTSRQTVTVNRSTSGRKTVLVTRPVWLFGTDDYLRVPNHPLLDMGNNQSFTAMLVMREWGTPTSLTYLYCADGAAATMRGFVILNNVTPKLSNRIGDGITRSLANDGSALPTAGALHSRILIRNRQTRTVASWLSNTPATSGSSTDSTTQSLASGSNLFIGSTYVLDGFAAMELFAVAIFRRALTATEIATINTYYGTA